MREAGLRRELESQEAEMTRLREELKKCQDVISRGTARKVRSLGHNPLVRLLLPTKGPMHASTLIW